MLRSEDHPPPPGERRLASAMQSFAPAVWDYDIASGTFLASARFFDIYGFAPGEPVGLADFIDATHPGDRSWTEALKRSDQQSALLLGVSYRYRIHRATTGEVRWIRARIETTRIGKAGPPVAFTGVIEDITDETEAVAAASESEERLRLAVEAGKLAVWDVDIETGAISHSLELNRLCGFPPEARPSFDDVRSLYAPGEKERLEREGATIEVIRGLVAEATYGDRAPIERPSIQAEVSIVTPAGVQKRLLLRAMITPTRDGRSRVIGVLVDITERKRAEERLAVVARELQHRVKNSLALVQAIAVQSFRGQVDVATAIDAYLGRLRALGAATNIVLEGGSDNALVGDVVRNILAPYQPTENGPFTIAGPAATIGSKAANALAMILHELCTNAVKYGALGAAAGRVAVTWSVDHQGRLHLDWTETGGPAVAAPTRKGFGTRLIETLAAGDLAGSAVIDYSPEGLVCAIVGGEGLAIDDSSLGTRG